MAIGVVIVVIRLVIVEDIDYPFLRSEDLISPHFFMLLKGRFFLIVNSMVLNQVSKIVFRCIISKIVLISLSLVLSIACNQCTQKNRTSKNSDLISSIFLNSEINDTLKVDLFKLAKNVSIVTLEQTPQSLVGNIFSISVGDGYIFVGTEKDYFIFQSDGSFVRSPFSAGRGPGEILYPLFCTQIRNNKIWVYESNNRHCIKSYNIVEDGWQTYNLPEWANDICRIVIDTDSSIAYINRQMHLYGRVTIDFTYIKQNLNGKILDSIPLGKNSSEFGLSYSLINNMGSGLLAMNPRGDSLIQILYGKYSVVWRNFFSKVRTQSGNQYFEKVMLVHYSSDTIILERTNVITTGTKTSVGKSDLIFIDRRGEKMAIMKLFLQNQYFKIIPEKLMLLGDNKFCICITSNEMLQEIKDECTLTILKFDNLSFYDNPYLIFGEFI